MKKRTPLRAGDIVRPTTKYLRRVAWYLDVPIDGIVLHVETNRYDDGQQLAQILWHSASPGESICYRGDDVEPIPPGYKGRRDAMRHQPELAAELAKEDLDKKHASYMASINRAGE